MFRKNAFLYTVYYYIFNTFLYRYNFTYENSSKFNLTFYF